MAITVQRYKEIDEAASKRRDKAYHAAMEVASLIFSLREKLHTEEENRNRPPALCG